MLELGQHALQTRANTDKQIDRIDYRKTDKNRVGLNPQTWQEKLFR